MRGACPGVHSRVRVSENDTRTVGRNKEEAACYTAPGIGRVPRGTRKPRPDGCRRSRLGRWVCRSARACSVPAPGGAGSWPVLPACPPWSPLPSGRCRGGSGPRERRCSQASTAPNPIKPDAATTAATAAKKARPTRFSALVRAMSPTRASGTSRQTPDLRAALASVRAGVPAGSAAAGPASRRDVGGDVGGEVSQVPISPRGERQANPCVQFVVGYPVLYERDLEQFDHLLAIRTGRSQAAPAAGSWCPVVSRLCHHRCLLPARRGNSVTRLHPWGHLHGTT